MKKKVSGKLRACCLDTVKNDKKLPLASQVKELSKEEGIRLQYRLGLAYESSGMIQEAVKTYHEIINLDSNFLDVRNRIQRLQGAS